MLLQQQSPGATSSCCVCQALHNPHADCQLKGLTEQQLICTASAAHAGSAAHIIDGAHTLLPQLLLLMLLL